MDRNTELAERFAAMDARLGDMEAILHASQPNPDLDPLLEQSAGIARDLMRAYAWHAEKPMPETEDLLELFRAFVKGDPSLNAIRDNVRELVYYRNCLDMGQAEALPARPANMAVRTARHLYLYLRTRSTQEQRLP